MGKLYFSLLLTLFSLTAFAQGTISGTLVDGDSNEPLIGANVVVKGTSIGTITDFDGNFALENVPNGTQTIEISYIGFATTEQSVDVNGNVNMGSISVGSDAIGLSEINVVASIAIDRKTPVAVSTLNAEQIEATLGSQELPEVMNTTPGVYATKGSGGYGDSRINIRGFDQRNIAVLINGVPVNDMENGWVYWSNWAGLGDAVKTIQVQRGLGASKLAISSVGGTMNLITKTSEAKKGGVIRQEISDFGTSKTMIGLNTGMSDKNMAVSFVGSRTFGDGYVDGTYINAWSYYLSVYKEINKDHSLQFTVIGAPQKHGQRDNSRFSAQSFEDFDQNGTKYNPNWGTYQGEFLNERNNYYHKPQIALNHYWNINEKNFLATSYYVSTGNGGGSGVLGKENGTDGIYMQYGPGQDENGQRQWDNALAVNQASSIGSYLIKRNSVNNHFWTGVLSTLKSELNENLNFVGGIDGRYYKGEHYREVRDLLGGDYWQDANTPQAQIGDRIAYDNDGTVSYAGLFSQLEYSKDKFNAFVGATVSNTWYGRQDRYQYALGNSSLDAETASRLGYNAKVGANYNINDNHNVYINAGYYSRAPFHNYVFVENSNIEAIDDANEKITSFEIGYGMDYNKFSLDLNAYYTSWADRWISGGFDYDKEVINGMDTMTVERAGVYQVLVEQELHIGVEVEAKYKVNKNLELGLFGSLGAWDYSGGYSGTSLDAESRESLGIKEGNVNGVNVANQAQTSFGALLDYNNKNFGFGLSYRFYDDLYAQFDVDRRSINDEDGQQAYKLPAYGILDARLHYKLKLGGLDSKVFIQGYNILDEITPLEGFDNAQRDSDGNYASGKESFKGFWTRGRNFNFGLKIQF